MKLFLALVTLVLSPVVIVADETCPNSDGWSHGHIDPKPQTKSQLECTSEGLTLTLTSPANAWRVAYQVGHFEFPHGPTGPPGKFLASENPKCSAVFTGKVDLPETTTKPNVAPVTSRPVDKDPFGDFRAIKSDEVVTSFSFNHGDCAGTLYGSDPSTNPTSYGQELIVRVTELLSTGVAGISFPTTTHVGVNCDNTVEAPEGDSVKPDIKPESVERCRNCQFEIAAKTLPVGWEEPDQIQATLTKGTCPTDPIFSWFVKSLNYNKDAIVLDGKPSQPIGEAINTVFLESDGFLSTTDLVVLDTLKDLSISAELGYHSSDGLQCIAYLNILVQ